MAIDRSGTFEYEAEFSEQSFSDGETVLRGAQRGPSDDMRLVGHHPTIRFSKDKLTLVASDSDRPNSTIRMCTILIGDAIRYAAQPGDNFYITAGSMGGTGLSLLRKGHLVMALGAISLVPLGDDSLSDRFAAMRERDTAEHGGYQFYVEHPSVPDIEGLPASGTIECVSVCRAEDPRARTLAMRAAILLAQRWATMVDWDWASVLRTAPELETRLRRSVATWRNEQPQDSLATLLPLVRAHPRDARLQTLVGFVYYDSERIAEAIPHLEAAVAADPRYASACRGLLHSLWDTGERSRGLIAARTLVDLTGDPEDRQMLASIEAYGRC